MTENTPLTVFQVEQEFDEFFREVGFRRVSESGKVMQQTPNADYCSENGPTIAELKVIEKDYFERGGIVNLLHGLVPAPTFDDGSDSGVSYVTMPSPQAGGRMDTMEPALRRLLKKAESQIRGTKQAVFGGEGLGLLVIALHGYRSARYEIVVELLAAILSQGEFPSVTAFMVCSPQWSWWDPNIGDHVHPCIVSVPEGLPEEWRDHFYALGTAYCDWKQTRSKLT